MNVENFGSNHQKFKKTPQEEALDNSWYNNRSRNQQLKGYRFKGSKKPTRLMSRSVKGTVRKHSNKVCNTHRDNPTQKYHSNPCVNLHNKQHGKCHNYSNYNTTQAVDHDNHLLENNYYHKLVEQDVSGGLMYHFVPQVVTGEVARSRAERKAAKKTKKRHQQKNRAHQQHHH